MDRHDVHVPTDSEAWFTKLPGLILTSSLQR